MQVWPEGFAGMELKVNGFSHKLPLLLEQLVKALVALKVRSVVPVGILPLTCTPAVALLAVEEHSSACVAVLSTRH